MCTTQAPHCDVSQPTWVPVSRKFSRSNCTNSVRGSTSTVTGLPFTVSETAAVLAAIGLLLDKKYRSNVLISRPTWVAGVIRGQNHGVFAEFDPRKLELL
jgi:hypothetical protein